MRKVSRSFVVALAFLASASCDRSRPTAPSAPGVKPDPAPGTVVILVPLPESADPMKLWLQQMDPARDGQLVVGKESVVALACTAPGGYRYHIGGRWVIGGQPDPTPGWNFGSTTGTKCDFPIGGWVFRYQVIANTPGVESLRLYVWVKKGTDINVDDPNKRPPDVTQDIALEWKAPIG